MESKKDIRKHVLEKRNQLNFKEWKEKSDRIYHKVVSHPFFLETDAIYCYIDYRNEAETRPIIQRAWEMGKKVAVPRVEGEMMAFYYIQSFSDLIEGYKGIFEPLPQFPANNHSALVIMPGAVFDKQCNRIGYGKGYYDKYLNTHSSYRTLAIAFELQVLECIPSDSHDIRPEYIITEDKIYAKQFAE